MYFISTTTNLGTSAYKAICTDPAGTQSAVNFKGTFASMDPDASASGLKTGRIKKNLFMQKGDVILYQCHSVNMTTLVSDGKLRGFPVRTVGGCLLIRIGWPWRISWE